MNQNRLIAWTLRRIASLLARWGYYKLDYFERLAVRDYRIWMRGQSQKAQIQQGLQIADGACGGCPSASSCDDAELDDDFDSQRELHHD